MIDGRFGDEAYSAYSRDAVAAAAAARRAARGRAVKRGVGAVLAILAVLAVLLVAALSIVRWFAHDDAADFRGVWEVQGSEALSAMVNTGAAEAPTITITSKTIVLDVNTTYKYTLDTRSKVVTFTFLDLAGTGHYRFSADRTRLAIVDGKYNWFGTCLDDFGWILRCWWAQLTGGPEPELATGDALTLLVKVGTVAADPEPGDILITVGGQKPVTPTPTPAPDGDAVDGMDGGSISLGDLDAAADGSGSGADADPDAAAPDGADDTSAAGDAAASSSDAA